VALAVSYWGLASFGGEPAGRFAPLAADDLKIVVGDAACENGKTSKLEDGCASTETRCEEKTDKVTFEVQADGSIKIVTLTGNATFPYNFPVGCTNTSNFVGLCNAENSYVPSQNSQGNVTSWEDIPCEGTHKVGSCIEEPITVKINVPIPETLRKAGVQAWDIVIPGAKHCKMDPAAQTQHCPAGTGATKSKEQNKCNG